MSTSTSNSSLPQSKFGLGSDHADLIVFLVKYFRIVAMVFVVWLIGYLNFSLSWILIASFLYMLREKNRSARTIKSEMIKAIGINEKDAIMARLDEVPSWVFFPDQERAEWVNKILKQMWPNLRVYIQGMMISTVEPIINQYSQSFVGKIKFEEVDLGDIPPRIGSVKVYTENIPNGEIIIDMEVLYAGDAHIKLKVKGIIAGVKDIQFHGTCRIILKPLCSRIPFAASMTLFFLQMPQIEFNLTNLANTFDMPGIRKIVDSIISDTVSKILVLPNRLVIPLMPDFDILELDTLKTIKPRGIFRVHVIKAQNLKNADFGILGKGKSDPYVKIMGLGTPVKTRVVQDNLNPVWNETFNFMIESINPNPNVKFEVFDEDIDHDDFLGEYEINIDRVVSKRKEEGYFKLKNVSHGEIYLRLEWYYLSTNKSTLGQIRKLKEFRSNQATCLLIIDLKSVNELPYSAKNSGAEPYPKVVLRVRDIESKSAVKERTTNPKYNENFNFFVFSPEDEKLECQVLDEKANNHKIASMEYSIFELLNEENLTVDRKFDLTCLQSGYLPKISMKLSLKILNPYKDNEDPSVYEAAVASQSSATAANDGTRAAVAAPGGSGNIDVKDPLMNALGAVRIKEAIDRQQNDEINKPVKRNKNPFKPLLK